MPSAPGSSAQPLAQPFSVVTAPAMTRNSEIEPTIGQWLLCGT